MLLASKNDYLVSIIMPCFNSANFIQESIDSVLSQTYHNFELIIIDDASNDDSLDIIKSFSDNRIKIIELKKIKVQVFLEIKESRWLKEGLSLF